VLPPGILSVARQCRAWEVGFLIVKRSTAFSRATSTGRIGVVLMTTLLLVPALGISIGGLATSMAPGAMAVVDAGVCSRCDVDKGSDRDSNRDEDGDRNEENRDGRDRYRRATVPYLASGIVSLPTNAKLRSARTDIASGTPLGVSCSLSVSLWRREPSEVRWVESLSTPTLPTSAARRRDFLASVQPRKQQS